MKRQKLIAGNWKMHGSRDSVAILLNGIIQQLSSNQAEIAVFPPSIYIPAVAERLKDTPIKWGAQNVSANENGAYTGEISASMLVDFACKYVLVGHSERRQLYAENNELVAMKFAQAQHYGLIPVLCVGETKAERQAGQTYSVIHSQISSVLSLEGGIAVFANAVIAYEPVWAIGTGVTATSQQAQDVHAAIRAALSQQDPQIAAKVQILYGGSVNGSNARELLGQADIDGALVGGASLTAESFVEIITCTD